jgi:flagellar motility protein MotE (MotC chaperone)
MSAQKSKGALVQAVIYFLLYLVVPISAYTEVSKPPSLITTPDPKDDIVQIIEKKQKELEKRENLIKKEEERIKILKKELDEKIERYIKILNQLEDTLKELKRTEEERLEHVVKVYEAMPPEEAALKLSALDEKTAVAIILKMKSKKAGSILALIESQKAATITKQLLDFKKDLAQ